MDRVHGRAMRGRVGETCSAVSPSPLNQATEIESSGATSESTSPGGRRRGVRGSGGWEE